MRLTLICFAVAAALILGHAAFWWIAAERFQAAALDWIAARRAEGYAIEYDTVERGGFPFRLRLIFRDPSAASPGGGGWSWSGSRAVAEVAPWAPLRADVRTDGRQSVTIPGRGGPRVYSGSAGMLSASVAADRSLPLRAVAIRDLALTGRDNADAIAAGRVDMVLRLVTDTDGSAPGGAYALSVVASDLLWPARLRLPLGEQVSDLAVDAVVIGDPFGRPWPGGLLDWRDAGGTVEVASLDVRYGPLRVAGAGTLALDAKGQPMGTFTARGEGLPETLDALDRRGLLKGVGVASAKLVLRIVSRPSETGEPGVTMPLTLQDRVLSVASLPVLEVPAIRWPPPPPGGLR